MNPTPTTRLPALDATRAVAMLLVVLVHACAPYMHVPLRGLIMPLQQPAHSRFPDTIFWILRCFDVPFFFALAGFGAREYLSRRDPRAFLVNRVRRVALPLLIGYPVVLLLMHPIWLWGWVERGWAEWWHLGHFKFGPELQRSIWGFNHFWFLEYLFLYCILLGAIAILVRRKRATPSATPALVVKTSDITHGPQSEPNPAPSRPAPRAWRLLPLALLLIALSAWTFTADASWFLDFQNTYVPVPRIFAFYALFFILGLALRREWLPVLAKASPLLLLIAAVAVLPTLSYIYSSIWQTDHGPRQGRLLDSASDRATLGVLVSTVAIASTLGVLGVATLFVRRLGPIARFLVDAAYWTFLTHLVWIGLGVMLQHTLSLAPELKVATTATFAAAMSLVTFIPIRRTKLGLWLGATAPAPG